MRKTYAPVGGWLIGLSRIDIRHTGYNTCYHAALNTKPPASLWHLRPAIYRPAVGYGPAFQVDKERLTYRRTGYVCIPTKRLNDVKIESHSVAFRVHMGLWSLGGPVLMKSVHCHCQRIIGAVTLFLAIWHGVSIACFRVQRAFLLAFGCPLLL